MYRLEVTPATDRDLERLKGRIHRQDFERLRNSIRDLSGDPRPHNVRKIKGTEGVYRIKVGNYRVVYEVNDNHKSILIIQIVRRTETTIAKSKVAD